MSRNSAANLAQVFQLGDGHAVIPRLVIAYLINSWKPQRVVSLVLITGNDLGSFDLTQAHHTDNVINRFIASSFRLLTGPSLFPIISCMLGYIVQTEVSK